MKKKRTINISSLKLKKVRDSIRSIIYNSAIDHEANLIERISIENDFEKSRVLEQEKQTLNQQLENSILQCPICNAIDKNMVFNPTLKCWFCSDCYKMMADEYYARKTARARGADHDDFNERFYKSFTT